MILPQFGKKKTLTLRISGMHCAHCSAKVEKTLKELGCKAQPVLKKVRHTPPQSLLTDVAKRRANILGAYRVRKSAHVAGRTVLLLDDIITTGATASECAKTLQFAGVEKVLCAAVAVAEYSK